MDITENEHAHSRAARRIIDEVGRSCTWREGSGGWGARRTAEEHAIAEAIEAIAERDGGMVSLEEAFAAGKGGDESEKGGTREVEIGQERIHDAEGLAGIEEDAGFSAAGKDQGASQGGGFCGGILEGANHGGADGEDGAAGTAGGDDRGGGGGRAHVGFARAGVVFEARNADGLESAEADIEGERVDFDAGEAQAGEDFGGEMEAGGGSGDSRAAGGVNGLVTLTVGELVFAADIGRERNVSQAFDGGAGVARGGIEAEAAQAVHSAGQNSGDEFAIGEADALAGADFAAGTNQSFPDGWLEFAEEKDFDGRRKQLRGGAGRRGGGQAASEEAGGKDACIIEDHELIAAKERGKIAEAAIVEFAGGQIEEQEARGIARIQGTLGDGMGREVVIEIGKVHDGRRGVPSSGSERAHGAPPC